MSPGTLDQEISGQTPAINCLNSLNLAFFAKNSAFIVENFPENVED